MGKPTPQIQMYRHDTTYRVLVLVKTKIIIIGTVLSAKCCYLILLVKDIEEYGLLKFTPTSEAFLKKPTSFEIVLNNKFEDANAEDDEESDTPASGTVGQLQMKSCLKC